MGQKAGGLFDKLLTGQKLLKTGGGGVSLKANKTHALN